MTIEERIELHDQWLLSMESNHSQIAADLAQVTRDLAQVTRDLARVERAQALFAEQMVVVGQGQALFMTNLAALEAQSQKFREELRELRELIDRYIRFRGNGSQAN